MSGALGSIGGAIGSVFGGPVGGAIGSVAGSVAGGAVGGGGSVSSPKFQFVPFDAGGIQSNFDRKQGISVTTTDERQALIDRVVQSFLNQQSQLPGIESQFGEAFETQLAELSNLRGQLRPGFGALTEAQVGAIETARDKAVGNLRESLAKRRVAGSSFALAQEAQLERTTSKQGISVTTTDERQALIDRVVQSFLNQQSQLPGIESQFGEAFETQLAELSNLRGQLRPGFGALTEAQVGAIETARDKAVGNLRESLAKRRVAGSSFALAQEAQLEREFAQAEAEARAETTLQELDATARLIDQEFQVSLTAAQNALDFLNASGALERGAAGVQLEEQDKLAQIATGLASDAQVTLNNFQQIATELAVQEAQGIGELFGQLFPVPEGGIPGVLGDIFG